MESLVITQRKAILSVAQKHGITHVRVFGSMANNSATDESDVDLLVNFPKSTSLLNAIDFRQELQGILGRKVDVVDEASLSVYMRDRIINEALSL